MSIQCPPKLRPNRSTDHITVSMSIVMGQTAILSDVVCEITRFCKYTSEFHACAISSLRGMPGIIRGGIYTLVCTIVRLSFINEAEKPLYADALLTERLSSDQNVPSAFLLSTAVDPRSNRDASSIWSFAITLDLYLLAPPASRFFPSSLLAFIHSFFSCSFPSCRRATWKLSSLRKFPVHSLFSTNRSTSSTSSVRD